MLVDNAMHAVKEYGLNKFAIAGGVASNSSLRAAMKQACEKNEIEFYYPSPIFCTDNAAMIGVAAYYEYITWNQTWMGSECSPESETWRKIEWANHEMQVKRRE